MANEEAKKLLDALMGGDRNAPLPKGAAKPGSTTNNGELILQKKQRSCFDRNIDPLFTAWGIDVYDLFVNTKSDIGPNPYVADIVAHKEYRGLSASEQQRLGFDYLLFQKLQELTRSCDRVVSRNQEKLRQEIQRKKLSQNTYVEDVDPAAVETLARNMLQKEEMEEELLKKLKELDGVVQREVDAKKELEPLLTSGATPDGNDGKDEVAIKQEEDDDAGNDSEAKISDDSKTEGQDADKPQDLTTLQLNLGRLTLSKQKVLFDLARLVARISASQDTIANQRRQLNYVRSDISTDKTVCQVSGNFMSSRDADERIAAHYAGKQYMGWKLVRDKLKSLIQQYGRYGPPPPPRSNDIPSPRGGQRGGYGGGGFNRGGGGGGRGRDNYSRGGGGGNFNRGGGGGGYDDNRGRGGYNNDRGWRR